MAKPLMYPIVFLARLTTEQGKRLDQWRSKQAKKEGKGKISRPEVIRRAVDKLIGK